MLVTLESVPIANGIEHRAMKTVPKGILEIKPSSIHGVGVFALKEIHKGVRMGPYEGSITRLESTKGYSWKLKDGRLVMMNCFYKLNKTRCFNQLVGSPPINININLLL